MGSTSCVLPSPPTKKFYAFSIMSQFTPPKGSIWLIQHKISRKGSFYYSHCNLIQFIKNRKYKRLKYFISDSYRYSLKLSFFSFLFFTLLLLFFLYLYLWMKYSFRTQFIFTSILAGESSKKKNYKNTSGFRIFMWWWAIVQLPKDQC